MELVSLNAGTLNQNNTLVTGIFVCNVFVFTFRSGWFKDKNSVTGSSNLLTVCIANDLAAKRLGHKQHANIIKKFGGNNSYMRKYGSEYIIYILCIHYYFCALESPDNTFLTRYTFIHTFYRYCMYAHVCCGGRVCVHAQAHRYGPKPCLQSAFFALLYEDSEGQNLLKSYALLW